MDKYKWDKRIQEVVIEEQEKENVAVVGNRMTCVSDFNYIKKRRRGSRGMDEGVRQTGGQEE